MENIITNQEILTTEATETEIKAKRNVWEILNTVRYFTPLISSVGAIIWIASKSTTLGGFGILLMLIGFTVALTVCPLKLLTFPFKCIPAGFKLFRGFIPFYGVADLVAALVGTVTGFVVGLFLTLMVPAYFTIKKYFAKTEEI